MNSPLHILKLGGSVVSDKTKPTFSPRSQLITEACEKLQAALAEHPAQLLIVHGGGGEVHALADEYDLREGANASARHLQGALETKLATQRLNQEILRCAIAARLPAVSVHTASVIFQSQGEITSLHMAPIEAALKNSLVPVLYGEMVFDDTLGMSICSGDKIVSFLSQQLPVTQISYATDVAGIYTVDPYMDDSAVLLESINLSRPLSEQVELGVSHNLDVTDGLRGKLSAVDKLFMSKTLESVHIFNGLEVDNYEKLFAGQSFVHTVITK